MTTFDPADTFSGKLPSLPPVPRDDGGELPPGVAAVFDPRFPIEWTLQSRIWQDTIRDWDGTPGFTAVEVARATEQDTLRKVYGERRFVQPLHVTVPIPAVPAAIAAPIVHPELGEAALQDDWDTGPGVLAIPAAPRRHSHRGDGGRWAKKAS